jgi:hypothetical protein
LNHQCTRINQRITIAEENYCVTLEWLNGLPTITERFGCPSVIESLSFYAVRGEGSMLPYHCIQTLQRMFNTTGTKSVLLFCCFFDVSYCPLLLNVVTGKILCGPVILKLDSGPGRIVASHASISKREEFRKMGLLLLSSLPKNGPFKSATYARGKQLLTQKMKEQGVA